MRIKRIVRNIAMIDVVVVALAIGALVFAFIPKIELLMDLNLGLTAWGTSLSALIIGQVIVAGRHAWEKTRREEQWLAGVVPALCVIQSSMQHQLAALMRDDNLSESKVFRRDIMNQEDYINRIKRLLVWLEDRDFSKAHSGSSLIGLESGLKDLRDNIVKPMQDLIRWGVVVERIYSAKDREQESTRVIVLAIMELVITHYLVDIENFLRMSSNWPEEKPNALQSEFIESIRLDGSAGNLGFGSSDNETPQVARRITDALNQLGEPVRRLDLPNDTFPGVLVTNFYEFSEFNQYSDPERVFVKDYLAMIWYRSLLVWLGVKLVDNVGESQRKSA